LVARCSPAAQRRHDACEAAGPHPGSRALARRPPMQPRAVTLLLASLFIAACNLRIGDTSANDDVGTVDDGGVCKTFKDCKSGNCISNLCTGSACGPSSKDLSPG